MITYNITPRLALYPAFFCIIIIIVIDGKKTGPDPNREIYRSGQENCPCFCSERNDESGFNTFWVDKYPTKEPGVPDAFECGTSNCLNPSDYGAELGWCKEHVDYPFCPRKLKGWNGTSTSDFIKQLVNDAFNCWDTTVWEEDTECDKTIKRGACYTAFPRCEQTGMNQTEPKKICRSYCENERKICRTLKSAWGPNEHIAIVCAEEPYVDAEGPSKICTGTGSNLFVDSFYSRIIVLCAMTALLALIM
jgi:hypothetical protein